MSMTIVVFGATSAIAKEYCRLKSGSSDQLILVARNTEALEDLRKDLIARQVKVVQTICYDFKNTNDMRTLVNAIFTNGVDIALLAFGTLPDQEKCQSDAEYLQEHHNLNSTSTISLLSLISEKMKSQKSGTIAVITSVAGDRGKASNYYYGAAKASVSTFLQGLRQDLFKYDVHVLDIKPGFVNTPMTVNFDKGMLWFEPQTIARGIDGAIQKHKDVVYLPWFWKYIMCVIKWIPEFIFKKIKL
jgi:decaprenylphospho-beta-D-erythro-pentofuranosid-2-ulose 2-reductase